MRYYWRDPLPPLTEQMVLRAVGMWTVVVCLSAAPSFLLGLFPAGNIVGVLAMLTGLGIIIAVFVGATLSDWGRRLVRLPFVKTTLMIGYGVRMLLSVTAIVGTIFLDMIIGVAAGACVQALLGDLFGTSERVASGVATSGEVVVYFVGIVLWTLLTALGWNLALGAFMAVVQLAQWNARKMPVGRPGELCMACGYDVHMSTGACPECGEPIPPRMDAGVNDSLPTPVSTA
ncbi:MAG: zinc ribbon domain-containing protein [Planctomycetota bacterium]